MSGSTTATSGMSYLGGGTGGGGDGHGGNRVVLRGSDALQGTDVLELGVGDDDADGLGGVHGGAAADGDDGVGPAGPERGDAVLHVLDGRVRLDAGIDGVGDLRFVQQIRDLGGDAELHQIRVGADEDVLPSPGRGQGGDFFDGAFAVEGNGIEDNAVSHEQPPDMNF